MKVFDEIRAFEQAGFEMRNVNFEPLSKGLRKTHAGKGICAAIPFTCIFMGKAFPYWKQFPNDDSPIDMNEVIDYF